MSDMPTSAELRDEMRDTITTLRASLAAATAREGRLMEALHALFETGVIPKSSAREGGAMRFSSQVAAADLARAALKEPAP